MSITISLCICTYNRPEELDKCLHSVVQARSRPEQIIVSDDSQNGQPAQAIAARYPGVTYQKGPSRGLGANRNACLAAANQNFILFIDDDVCLDSDFFEKSRSVLARLSKRTILTGYEINYAASSSGQKITPHNPDFWGFQRVPPEDRERYRSIVINSAFFPANLFKSARFDEKLRYGSEELDMASHAISCGFSIQYSEEFYVHHYPSAINREEYQSYVEASRLYATFKAYWKYEKSLIKSALFLFLAPQKLLIALVRRLGLEGFRQAWNSTKLAVTYMTA